ncbi:hypothetical protein G6F62_014626 [Rhizopus arrhizus]|nr:hypothetical protein G6F62_014626 [Rhizopus arrhizus]
MTPVAVSRPNALPPDSTMACTFFHHVHGIQQIRLAGAGRGTAHIYPTRGARFGDDDRAAGRAAGIGVVAHAQPGHLGDAASPGRQPQAVGALRGHYPGNRRRARSRHHERPPVPLLFHTDLPRFAD